MDCIVHGVAKSPTQLSSFFFSTVEETRISEDSSSTHNLLV